MPNPPLNPTAGPGSWSDENHNGMPFHVLLPDNYDKQYSYPVILFLHQYENESDEPQQADGWFNINAFRARHPAIVIVPICNINGHTSDPNFNWGGVSPNLQQPMVSALEILQQVISREAVDPNRVYITGNSMGGLGTWGVLCNRVQREVFAAAMPVSGSCYYQVGNEATVAQQLQDFPIWSCHGQQDSQVSPQFDQTIMPILLQSSKVARFTNDPNGQHDTWDSFYTDPASWDWLFSQSKGASVVPSQPAHAPSADGATINKAGDQPLYDATGAAWTLVASKNGQCAVNGNVDATTQNVTKMAFSKGLIFQQNQAGGVWTKSKPSDTWATANAFPAPPAPNPTPGPTPTGSLKPQLLKQLDALTADVNSIDSTLAQLRKLIGTMP